jgi:hypothetical protein
VSWANKRFNPSTIVGKTPNAARANESDRIQVMRDEFFRRMDAKDAEIKALRDALERIEGSHGMHPGMKSPCNCPQIAGAALRGIDAPVALDHLPENNYA